MIFKVTIIEKDGASSWIVNANTVKGDVSFHFEFNSNVWVDVVGKLKVKSSNLYIYIYIYKWSNLSGTLSNGQYISKLVDTSILTPLLCDIQIQL